MRRTVSAFFAALLVLTPQPLHAEPENDWTWEVAPYGWFSGLSGDIDIHNVDVHVDKSFLDLLSNLDMAMHGPLLA